MKTDLLSIVSLILVANGSFVLAQGGAAAKHTPAKGHFEIAITSGEREATYKHPSKALRELTRAVSRAKRAKDGDAPVFEANLTLNEQVFTFSDPEAAFEACKTLTAAMRELPKLRMGLGDLGEIPRVKPEDQALAQQPNQPMPAKSKAAAVAEVRRRINLALQKQLAGGAGRGGYRRPSMPNPLTIQRIIQQEVEKARREGLLPSGTSGAPAGGGFAGGDPREAKKEAIVQTLAFVFSHADSVGKAEDPPAEKENSNEAKTEETKPDEKTPNETNEN